MELQHDVRDFLVSRRARLSPDRAGLPTFGGHRRVAGLRREEVALLAGVSVDYYARVERGQLAGVSEEVLDAVARALQLDDAEHQHLLDLARSATPPRPRRTRRPKTSTRPRDAVLSILHGLSGVPAYVRTPQMDIVAANQLCRALYAGALDEDKLPVNMARYLFLDPQSRGFYRDWDAVADDTVGALRMQAGRDTRHKALSDLIGELTTGSDAFAERWARQNVRLHRTSRGISTAILVALPGAPTIRTTGLLLAASRGCAGWRERRDRMLPPGRATDRDDASRLLDAATGKDLTSAAWPSTARSPDVEVVVPGLATGSTVQWRSEG